MCLSVEDAEGCTIHFNVAQGKKMEKKEKEQAKEKKKKKKEKEKRKKEGP